MPTISVIVPVYNVEKYLRCCVDSILAQTFTDIEVLLVDDGSTDGSGVICDEYVEKDSRVRVFHKENGGVSSARNLGLDEAIGKWIMFVDSDDKVDHEICDRLLESAESGFMPICALYNWEGEQQKRSYRKVGKERYPVKEFFKIGEWFLSPCARLFENTILKKEGLHFIENLSYGEDAVFNYNYVQFINEFIIIDKPLYYYRVLTNSLSRGKYIADYEEIMKFLLKKKFQLAEKVSVDMSQFLEAYYHEYFFKCYLAFENNMRQDSPGTLRQKMRRNDEILRSDEFKKAYPYRNSEPQYFNKRYMFMLGLSYCSGNYFWLWLLGIPGKIKNFLQRRDSHERK